MLEEYKQMCKAAADTIPNWQSLSKNDLCRLCVENEDNPELYNAYFAAIQYRYWGLIAKYYNACNKIVSPETCRDWLVDTIMYALKHRRWEDEDSTIYNDPNGPDKVINTKMKCMKINLYQYTNRKKRKDSFGIMSLDDLSERLHDSNFMLVDNTSEREQQNIDVKEYIKKLFISKDYFMAYMLDGILNESIFDDEDTDVDDGTNPIVKKLSKFLRYLTPSYCEQFASTYDVNVDVAISSLVYFKNLNIKKVNNKIEYNLLKLKHDPFILGILGRQ